MAIRERVFSAITAVFKRHGAVTIAVKEGLTWGGHCVPGDALGIVDGDIVLVGSDLTDVAAAVLHRLLGAGGELVTLVTGADLPDDLVHALEDVLRGDYPEVEVSVLVGGQTAYPLLVGVE
jgi:dihydroxyacetone kinase-like predicted kinase